MGKVYFPHNFLIIENDTWLGVLVIPNFRQEKKLLISVQMRGPETDAWHLFEQFSDDCQPDTE